jgi:hypothetical protein
MVMAFMGRGGRNTDQREPEQTEYSLQTAHMDNPDQLTAPF